MGSVYQISRFYKVSELASLKKQSQGTFSFDATFFFTPSQDISDYEVPTASDTKFTVTLCMSDDLKS